MSRGSHATWGRYDSRICIVCGQPIRITTQAAWMHHDSAGPRSAHITCGTPLKGGAMTEEPDTTEEPTTDDTTTTDDGDDDQEADGDGDDQ